MYKYLLGDNPKKSPGLPFIKMSLKYNKKNNISKKMDKSLIYLSRETELLVLGNNYLSEKQPNKNIYKTAENIENNQEEEIDIVYFKNKNKKKENIKKTDKNVIKKITKINLNNSKDYPSKRLNKIILREKNKNKMTNMSSMNSNSTIINNLSTKRYSNNTYRRSDNTTEKNTIRSLVLKNKNEENSESHLLEKVLSSKNIKKNAYKNISNLSSLLDDTTKKFILLNMKLRNYSQENKNIKKAIFDKSLKQSKSQEDLELRKINFKQIFDKKDNILDKPLKQIKDTRKNKMIWIKKSTANLLTFGKISQMMKDEKFYKERKRIIGNYLNYEKEADLYVKKKENEKNSFRSERGIKNLRKIDELLAQNQELLKNILKKDEDKQN